MPIKFRPRGIGLIVVGIVLFALAGFTRVGWLLLFDAVLWGTIAVSGIMPWIAIGQIRARRRVANWEGRGLRPGPMEGDEVDLELKLKNEGFLPCIFTNVLYSYKGIPLETQKERLFLAWLGRGHEYTSTTKVKFLKRGLHKLPNLISETSVPFGMFRRVRKIEDSTEVLVLPKVYEINSMEMVDNSGDTSRYSIRARVGEQITGSRSYVYGDPWHHIHWRNTARAGSPQVKEFERTPDNALVIAFDVAQTRQTDAVNDPFEYAVKIAASVGEYVCRTGGIARLVTSNVNLETNDREHLLKSLATLGGPESPRHMDLSGVAPPLSAVLMVVEDTDDIGLRAATQLAAGQRQMAVVVLRGFDKDNIPANPMQELANAGAHVVECWPGDIERCISKLSQAQESSHPKKSKVGVE